VHRPDVFEPLHPKLVYPAGVVGLFKGHRDMPLASGALMDPISRDLVASVHRLIRDEGVDLVQLARGQRRDDVALGYLARHDGSEGITLVGRAQERCTVSRTERRVSPRTGARHPFIVRASAVVGRPGWSRRGLAERLGPLGPTPLADDAQAWLRRR